MRIRRNVRWSDEICGLREICRVQQIDWSCSEHGWKSNWGAASGERKWGQMHNSMFLFSDQSGVWSRRWYLIGWCLWEKSKTYTIYKSLLWRAEQTLAFTTAVSEERREDNLSLLPPRVLSLTFSICLCLSPSHARVLSVHSFLKCLPGGQWQMGARCMRPVLGRSDKQKDSDPTGGLIS